MIAFSVSMANSARQRTCSQMGRRQARSRNGGGRLCYATLASDPSSESGREETKHTSSYEFGETQERAAEADEKKATRDLTDLSAGFPAAAFSAVRAVAGGSESSLFV